MYLRISYLLLICSLIATGCEISDEGIDDSRSGELSNSQESREATAEESTEETEVSAEDTSEVIVEETVTEETVTENTSENQEEDPEEILTEPEDNPEETESEDNPEETEPESDRETVPPISDEALVIRVIWDTANDSDQTDNEGTDIDLHFLHPTGEEWNQSPWDCYFANPSPDWGATGSANDPILTIDDVNGAGPEEIVYPEPLPTTDTPYQVGIDYYSSGGLFGADYGNSTVTVSVYIHGELIETASREMEMGEFYVPFEIRWSENGEGIVTALD